MTNRRRLSDKLAAISIVYLLVALAAVGVTLYFAWQLEGGAAAVNAMGSQRMRSYHIGMLLAQSAAPGSDQAELAEAVKREVRAFEATLAELEAGDASRPLVLPRGGDIDTRFAALQTRWREGVAPAIAGLLATTDRAEKGRLLPAYRLTLEAFVDEIDRLVMAMEQDISGKTTLLRLLQFGLIVLSVAGTVALIYLMFLLIVRPVSALEDGMRRMEAGDFGVRLPVETRDEFGMLAAGFNRMADRLSDLYQTLERRVAEKTQTLGAKNQELATLYGIAALLTEPASIEELCQSFLRELMARLGARAGAVRLTQADGGQLHLHTQAGLPADFVEAERCLPRGECLCGEAAKRQHGGVYPLTLHVPDEAGYRCARYGFATISIFPIRFRTEQLGVFNLFFAEPREFAAAERQMLETLGQHLGIAIENQRLIAREKEMAISEERNLLAQELHDSIAQSLAFLNIQAQMLEDSLTKRQLEEAQEELARIRDGIQASYDDVRELLVHFRTRMAELDIESAIASALERFERQTGIGTTFVQSGTALPLSPEDQIQALHIIQECLSNARKHSGAKSLRVEMERSPRYRFRVTDDGRGFDPQQVPGDTHVGIRIMRERAHRIGATLRVESKPDAGTQVTLELPPARESVAAA